MTREVLRLAVADGIFHVGDDRVEALAALREPGDGLGLHDAHAAVVERAGARAGEPGRAARELHERAIGDHDGERLDGAPAQDFAFEHAGSAAEQ